MAAHRISFGRFARFVLIMLRQELLLLFMDVPGRNDTRNCDEIDRPFELFILVIPITSLPP